MNKGDHTVSNVEHVLTVQNEFITDPVTGRSNIRFNDGVVDRQGRFWAGAINKADFYAPDSSLFRLDPDSSVHQLDTGFATSNELGFSPSGKTLCFVDMFPGKILTYDHDPATGAVENRRIFALVTGEAGYPAGITVDSEGFVWNVHRSGWKVTRYEPSGKIECEIRLPVQNVTRCAFGGELKEVA
ncbi:MAG: hypothetical protein Fur0044_51560 [Anaerolineae bacterium]